MQMLQHIFLFVLICLIAISVDALVFADETTPTLVIEATPSLQTTSSSQACPIPEAPQRTESSVPTQYDIMAQRIVQAIQANAFDPKRVGIVVEQISPSITVFEQNSNSGYPPGSLQKLITTAAALEYLGPDYKYSTELSANGRIVGSTVIGNLVVQGSGDPTLGSWLAGNPDDPTSVFREWAKDLKAAGITVVEGGIVGDDDLFDDLMEGPAWPLESRGEGQLAEVSALSFHDNCVEITFKGGRKVGKETSFSLKPKTDYIRFGNKVLTGAENKVELRRQKDTNLFTATGFVLPKKEFRTRASVGNPTVYTTTIMKDTLMREGINIKGELIDIDTLREKTIVTSGTLPVAIHTSPPMSEIISITNHFSQNLYAELILKTLGKEFGESGSFSAGCQVIEKFLHENQIDSSLIGIRDGSGLSSRNSLTPRFLVDLLKFMAKSKHADAFEKSLSKPGEYGAMQMRFGNVLRSDPSFADRVRCISGYSSGTASLAGYVTTPNGTRLAFAILVNDPRMERNKAYAVTEHIVAALGQAKAEVIPDKK